mmetsp:Transcript_644/g.1289  ORF Transcript_644/g.1289 Transcript_644/m.1289 type:complete len:210 (+) Transcript_644:137-766(+)
MNCLVSSSSSSFRSFLFRPANPPSPPAPDLDSTLSVPVLDSMLSVPAFDNMLSAPPAGSGPCPGITYTWSDENMAPSCRLASAECSTVYNCFFSPAGASPASSRATVAFLRRSTGPAAKAETSSPSPAGTTETVPSAGIGSGTAATSASSSSSSEPSSSSELSSSSEEDSASPGSGRAPQAVLATVLPSLVMSWLVAWGSCGARPKTSP